MNKVDSRPAAYAPTLTREEVLRRAEALIPKLRERAETAEKLRRCPDETIRDYVDSGLLRILQPIPFGGHEMTYDVYCETVQTLARGCGSQAWVYMVYTDNMLKLANFSKEAQKEVWSQDPNVRISNSVTPVGKGKPADGGVVWSGRHQFSSGVDHAQWVMATGTIEYPDGRKTSAIVLVPRSDITLIDDWHVMGLAGSGSRTFVIDNAFVPAYRILEKDENDDSDPPGLEGYTAPIFHMPRGGISTASYVSAVVGIAESMVEEYCKYTAPRKSRGTPIAELTGTQIVVGQSSAEIEAASRMYIGTVREAMELMLRGGKVSKRQNLQGKRNAAYAGQLCIAAVQRLFNSAGGRVLYTDHIMQRLLRDCLAAAAHHSLMWDTAAANYGRDLLGVKGKSTH